MLGHRQAFAWIDQWIDMSYEDVRNYEALLQMQTNSLLQKREMEVPGSPPVSVALASGDCEPSIPASSSSTPGTPKSPVKKGYFNWF